MKTALKIIAIILCAYLLFCGVVLFFYHRIRYDPEDGAATDFLHMSEALQKEIGEVRYVASRAFEKEIEDENGLHIMYSVETYSADYMIQVHFQKEADEWVPYDYSIIEVLEEFEKLYESEE